MSPISINQIKYVGVFIFSDCMSTTEGMHLCIGLTTMPIGFLFIHNWNDMDNFN